MLSPRDHYQHLIGGPREVLLSPDEQGRALPRIETEADYRAHALHYRQGRELLEQDERPRAYVNDGRWVADCVCGGGMSTSPRLPLAICLSCGSVYRPVFPRGWEEAEQELLKRPQIHTRNWNPHLGEALAEVKAERAARVELYEE